LKETAALNTESNSSLKVFRAANRLEASPTPPSRIAIVIAVVVVTCETLIMFLLEVLHPMPIPIPALVDSSILLACLAVFYIVYFRPFWDQHQQFALEVSHLSRCLMSSVEDERKRLSHDLHDQCGQTLTALQLRMDALRKLVPPTHKQQQKQMVEIKMLLSQLSNEIREVSYHLHPVILDKVGLVSALESMVADFAALHPEIEIVENYQLADELPAVLDEHGSLALYRICQECLNNIAKHAEANRISISLGQCTSYLTLVIEDNGKGFTIRRIHGGRRHGRMGIGLLGIRERVADLNGTLDVNTAPGSGTCVTVQVPINGGKHHG